MEQTKLEERLVNFHNERQKLSNLKKDVADLESDVKQEERDLAEIILEKKLQGFSTGKINVEVKPKEIYVFPAKASEDRVKFKAFVRKHFGDEFLENNLSMPYTTVTKVQETSIEEGWINAHERADGLPEGRISFKLKTKLKGV